jgi:hypothetical protein
MNNNHNATHNVILQMFMEELTEEMLRQTFAVKTKNNKVTSSSTSCYGQLHGVQAPSQTNIIHNQQTR